MHPNFYHWHSRSDLKTDPALLEKRWGAAVEFGKELAAADVRSLLRLILLPETDAAFASRFTEALVKSEPTFPIEKNSALLRVMAAAVAFEQLERPSAIADSFALGLAAAEFPERRVEPVCNDIMVRSAEYLAHESERVRPNVVKATPQAEVAKLDTALAALKKATDSNQAQEVGKAVDAALRTIRSNVVDAEAKLIGVLERMMEETQFLWWAVGRRSPELRERRERLSAKAYAFPVALEAAARVAVLPPPSSAESLLEEALSQCEKGGAGAVSFGDLLPAPDSPWLKNAPLGEGTFELAPLSAILHEIRSRGEVGSGSLKKWKLTAGMKVAPAQVSRQFFRELMLERSLTELGK